MYRDVNFGLPRERRPIGDDGHSAVVLIGKQIDNDQRNRTEDEHFDKN